MTSQDITQLINSLGFPIVVCGYFAWDRVKSDKQHKEEVDKLAEALNNNTLVMQKLIDKLEE